MYNFPESFFKDGKNEILGVDKVGDWATHRLSYPITKEYEITHGYALALIFTSWIRVALKYNSTTMIPRLRTLGEMIFDEPDYQKVPGKLEELFDIASNEDNELNEPIPGVAEEVTKEALSNLEKIETALPTVRGLEASDREMDELSKKAETSFQDLMDLGMQVDSRFSGDIFSVASNMLNHAITAKTAKLNKKLKMIDLQLKKATLDQRQAKADEKIDNIPLGEGQNLDRNELLRVLSAKNTEE